MPTCNGTEQGSDVAGLACITRGRNIHVAAIYVAAFNTDGLAWESPRMRKVCTNQDGLSLMANAALSPLYGKQTPGDAIE